MQLDITHHANRNTGNLLYSVNLFLLDLSANSCDCKYQNNYNFKFPLISTLCKLPDPLEACMREIFVSGFSALKIVNPNQWRILTNLFT